MLTHGVSINTLDPRALSDIQWLAKNGDQSDEALRAASKQVEALFLQMMLKAMRDASPANGPLDSDQTRLAQELHDQQLASDLAQSKGTGLAEALFRQLRGGQESAAQAVTLKKHEASQPGTKPTVAETAALSATIDAARKGSNKVPQHVRDFVASVWPCAAAASRVTGIPAHFMVAQAALETGWGAFQPKNADGSPSYNLFNIKAGRDWQGPTTRKTAVDEHVAGRWRREKTAFRAYSSYAEAFSDYAKLLTASPRYANVVGQCDAGAFARGLQNAGYATDPMYASKLMRIIGGNTLKNALAHTA